MAIRFNLLMFASCLLTSTISACQITNIEEIIGVPLSSNVWGRIAVHDRTTPDNVFLGGIRAFFLGNATDVKFYFTDGLWRATTGLEPDAMITDSQIQTFRNAICDGCISNQMVVSCLRTTTNDMQVINSTITENVGSRVSTNDFRFVFLCTNSTWRIDDLFLDGSSVKCEDGF